MFRETSLNLLVTMLIALLANTNRLNLSGANAVENIFSNMGWQNMTFIPCCGGSMKSSVERLKSGSALGLQINILKPEDINMQFLDPGGKVVFEICDIISILKFLKVLSMRRPPDSTLVEIEDPGTLAKFRNRLSVFSLSRSFFRISQRQLFHHITFRKEVRLLENKIDCKPQKCTLDLNSFSYQGAKLYGKAKTWSPWFVLEEIHGGGTTQLKTSGAIHEFMDIVSSHYNFTLVPDPATEWGSLPVTGDWQDPNATFVGIFDDAVQGNTDMVLSFYTIMADRNHWVDMSFALYQSKIQFLINSQVHVPDLAMLWRPLTLHSWILVATSTITVAGGIFIPRKLIKDWDESWYSCRVAVITGWLLFNLVNAYYNGALTMFLASAKEIEIPTLEEGLALYPNWKMVVPLKSQLNFFLLSQKNKPQVREYINRVSGKETHLIPDDYVLALELMLKPGHFMYLPDPIALSHKFEKISGGLHGLTLESVGDGGFTRSGILLPKYSPHTKMINSGDFLQKSVIQ